MLLSNILQTLIYATDEPITPLFLYNNQDNLQQDPINTSIHHYPIKNADIQTSSSRLKILFPELKIISFPSQQLLSFKASPKTAKKIISLLKKWDHPQVQIRFYTHIYEIATESLKNTQNLLSSLSDPFSLTYDIIENKLTPISPLITHLHQLESNGEATLVAHPMIATTLQKEAEIQIGDKIPYESTNSNGTVLSSRVTQMDTGLHIKITPSMIHNTQIHTQLDIKIETIKVWKQLKTSEFPILSKRWIKTTLSLTDKTPFIIAGLTQENKKKNSSHPSLLRKIPLLNTLASKHQKNATKTDLLIIIIPEIMTSSPQHK